MKKISNVIRVLEVWKENRRYSFLFVNSIIVYMPM